VKRTIELAIAAAVQTVAVAFARRGWDWGNACHPCEVRVCGESLCAGGMTDQDRGGDRSAAELGEQLRAVCHDKRVQFALDRLGIACDLSNVGDELQGDLAPCCRLHAPQAPVDPVELARVVELTGGDLRLQVGAEQDQVPAQAVARSGALDDEVLAVVSQQTDLHGCLVEMSDGEALRAFSEDRSCDSARIDLVRLAWLSLSAARGAHHLGWHAKHSLSGCHQRPLEAGRDVSTVLDRPDQLVA
jgi:hypothetical protein